MLHFEKQNYSCTQTLVNSVLQYSMMNLHFSTRNPNARKKTQTSLNEPLIAHKKTVHEDNPERKQKKNQTQMFYSTV